MKIIKILFYFIFVFLILTIISYYYLNKNYNLKKIIDNIENNYNVDIALKEKPKWFFFPKLQLNLNTKIEHNSNNYVSKTIDLSFVKSYNLSSLNFKVYSDSLFIKALEIKFLDVTGNYKFIENVININSLNGKIGEGNFDSKAIINLKDTKKIQLNGNLNNIYLNQLLRQLGLANWQRLELKLSSKNFKLTSNSQNFLENIEGRIPLTGSMYFVVTEDERFGIAFLRLLIEKIPGYKNLSKSLSQITDGFSNSPALIKGELYIKEGIINSENLYVENDDNKIKLQGSYDMINDLFDVKISFFNSNNIVVEALILGNIENPSIQIINENNNSNIKENNNDLKIIFDKGIKSLIDKLLKVNE